MNPKKIPNARKWTPERVLEILAEIKADSYSGEVLYLNMALARQNLYSEIWSYWRRTFREHELISEEMLRIETRFEVRLFEAACQKQVPLSMAMFALRHHHRWNGAETLEPEPYEPEPIVVRYDENTLCLHDSTGHVDQYVRVEPLELVSGVVSSE